MNYDSFLSHAAESMRQSPIRQMGTVAAQRADLISFAPGYPGPDSFAWDEYRVIADRVLASRDRDLLQYGPTRGYRPLIGELVGLLSERGIRATGDEVLVTTGSQQGLDLVARTLIDPGDVVLVELPSYTGALGAFRNAQAMLVGVRQDGDGIEPGALDATLARLRGEGRRVKFVYVVPNFQNPTGLLMSLERRRWLLEWAAREDLLIVEDDPYGALYFEDCARPEDTRAIKADDRDGRVIYLSSLSKTLAPGFRTAWVVAPTPLAAKLEIAKQAADLCTGNFDQRIVYEAIRTGVLARHMPDLRRYYASRRTAMETSLHRELAGLLSWPAPRGGFFLWAALPGPLRAPDLLNVALGHGVIFVSGHAFFVDGSGASHIRLAFSLPTPERIEEGVRRLSLAVQEALAAPRGPVDQVPPAVGAGRLEPSSGA
jgi:2-aminoadipate transaminase